MSYFLLLDQLEPSARHRRLKAFDCQLSSLRLDLTTTLRHFQAWQAGPYQHYAEDFASFCNEHLSISVATPELMLALLHALGQAPSGVTCEKGEVRQP